MIRSVGPHTKKHIMSSGGDLCRIKKSWKYNFHFTFVAFFFWCFSLSFLLFWLINRSGAHRSGSRERELNWINSWGNFKQRHGVNEFIITHSEWKLGYQINANILCTFKLNLRLMNACWTISMPPSRVSSLIQPSFNFYFHSVSLNFWAFRLCIKLNIFPRMKKIIKVTSSHRQETELMLENVKSFFSGRLVKFMVSFRFYWKSLKNPPVWARVCKFHREIFVSFIFLKYGKTLIFWNSRVPSFYCSFFSQFYITQILIFFTDFNFLCSFFSLSLLFLSEFPFLRLHSD